MQRISRQNLSRYPRPLQGGVRVLSGGTGKRPRTLAQQYQDSLDKANAANEGRYKGILTGYDDLSKRVSGELANVGQMEQKDINRQYKGMGSDVYQRLVNRGFGNSSLTGTMQMGVERERTDAMARSAERLAMMRANTDMDLSQGRFGVMERRTDQGPDPNQLIQLSQGLGRSGAGGWQQGPDGRMYGPQIGWDPYAQQRMAMAQAQQQGQQPTGSPAPARNGGPAMDPNTARYLNRKIRYLSGRASRAESRPDRMAAKKAAAGRRRQFAINAPYRRDVAENVY